MTSEGRRERRVKRYETETVTREVSMKLQTRQTSDYSSQESEEGEPVMVTSTPLTPITQWKPIVGGSPRLRAFDGDGWVWSPRTSYTYAKSLTYRDTITPGREIPMPHMTRLPLTSYTPLAGDHTELWTLSQELSGEGHGPSPPHWVYRRVTAAKTSVVKKIFHYILLPFLLLFHMIHTIFYEWPKHCIQSSSVRQALQMFKSSLISVFSSILFLPLTIATYLRPVTDNSFIVSQQEADPQEILTEDEDESGLEAFLSNQKLQSTPLSEAHQSSNAAFSQHQQQRNFFSQKISIFWESVTTLVSVFSIHRLFTRGGTSRGPKRVIFKDVPEMPKTGGIDPYTSDDEFQEKSVNYHYVEENGELLLNSPNSPRRSTGQRISRSGTNLISALLYPFIFLQSIVTSSASAISSSWKTAVEASNFPEDSSDIVLENASQENSETPKKVPKSPRTPRKKKEKQLTWREWFWSFLYRKKPVRRSRRLQGLAPEQVALLEKKRKQRRLREKTVESSMQSNFSEDLQDDLLVISPKSSDFMEQQIDVDEEEHELVFAVYYRNILDYIANLLDDVVEDDHSEKVDDNQDIVSEETTKVTQRRSKKSYGFFRSILTWIVSILFSKQVRRSRRLRGLKPENSGFEQQSTPRKRRSVRKVSVESEEDEVLSNGDFQDLVLEEEYIEFFLVTWIKSLNGWISRIFKSSQETPVSKEERNSEEEIQKANKANANSNSVWKKFTATLHLLFFKKQVRRSRRLKGLEPENAEFQKQQSSQKKRRSTRNKSVDSEEQAPILQPTEEYNDEEYYELFIVSWIKSLSRLINAWISRSYEEQMLHNTDNTNQEIGVASNEKKGAQGGLLNLLKSLLFKTHMRRSRRLRGLAPENGEYVGRGWGRKRITTKMMNVTDNNSATSEVTEEELEFRLLYLVRSVFGYLRQKLVWRSDQSLSVQNVRRHDQEMLGQAQDDDSESSVKNWLRGQSGQDNNQDVSTMADLSFEEQQIGKKTNMQANEENRQALNIFSFAFSSFVPSWSTEWFWKYKGDRKSRRLRGMDPVEEDAFDKWKAKTLKDNNQEQSLASLPSSISENDRRRNKILWPLVILPLLLGLIFISCYYSPNTCSNLYQSSHGLLQSVANSTSNTMDTAVGNLKELATAGGRTLAQIPRSTSNFLANLIELSVSSGGTAVNGVFSLMSSTLNVASDLLTMPFMATWSYLSALPQHLPSPPGLGQLENATSFVVNTLTSCGQYISHRVSSTFNGINTGLISTAKAIQSATFVIFEWFGTNISTIKEFVSNVLFSLVDNILSINYSYPIMKIGNALSTTFSSCGSLGSNTLAWLKTLASVGSEAVLIVVTYPASFVSTLASAIPSTMLSVGSGLSFLVSNAWNKTSSLLMPITASSESGNIDYDLLVGKILDSHQFQTMVSKIANDRIEIETLNYEEDISKLTAADEEQKKLLSEQYLSSIEKIKADVEDQIKKLSEDILKSNLPGSQSIESSHLDKVKQLETQYQSLLEQSSNKEDYQGLLKLIEMLNAELKELKENQKLLNETLTNCCRNQTMIEVTVEKYVNDLLQSLLGYNSSLAAPWVNSIFVAKSELEQRLEELSANINNQVKLTVDEELRRVSKAEAEQTAQTIMDTVSGKIKEEMLMRQQSGVTNDTGSGLNREEVFKIVKNALIQYDADKTGLFDYALETAGGSVISTRCTETYVQKTAMYSIFGIPIWYPSNNPRTVIQPGVQPGECWAFKGSTGYIVIQLSEAVVPTRFSMEHISKSMSPSGKIDSAPREFVVYGLRSEKDPDPYRLGAYSYNEDMDPLQYFEVMHPSKEAFAFIELDINSNHGNINYTCLYRFRVHGILP